MDIIENACRQIMAALKKGSFSKSELEFLLRFFQEIVKSTEVLLNRINPDRMLESDTLCERLELVGKPQEQVEKEIE